MSAAERPVPPPRLPPVDRLPRRPEPFKPWPALADLGESPDWRGYSPEPTEERP